MKKDRIFQLLLILFLIFPFFTLTGMEIEEERALLFAEEAEYMEKIEQFTEEFKELFERKNVLQEYFSVRFLYEEPEIIERTVSFLRAQWLIEASILSDTLQDVFYPELQTILSRYAEKHAAFQVSIQTLRDGRYIFSFPDITEYLRHSDIPVGTDSCWIFVLQIQELPGATFDVDAYLMGNMKSILQTVLEQYQHDPKVLYRLGFYGQEEEEALREDIIYTRKHPDYRSFSAYELEKAGQLGPDYISFDSINSRQIFHKYHGHYIILPYLRANRFFNNQYLFSVFTLISPEEMNKITSVKPFIADKPYFEEEPFEEEENDIEGLDIDEIDIEDIQELPEED